MLKEAGNGTSNFVFSGFQEGLLLIQAFQDRSRMKVS